MKIDEYGNFGPIWPNICIFHARDTFGVGQESQKSPPTSEASRVNGIVLGLDFFNSFVDIKGGLGIVLPQVWGQRT